MAQDNAAKDNGRDDSYDDEIIALLHQVGQRLLHSEQDRKELKRAMDDLAEKNDQGERAYLTLQDRLNKTESIIETRQKKLEKIQREQMARIEKAAIMADKVEEAFAQHARINRRLDKLAQDKARTIRKLERIEEAVLETHDVINARALAAPAGRETKTDTKEDSFKNWLPQAPAANDADTEEERPWWKQHGPVRAAAISAMVLIGIAGGWAVSNIQQTGYGTDTVAQISEPDSSELAYYEAGPSPSFDDLMDYEEDAATESTPDKQSFTRAIEQALNEAPAETEETEIDVTEQQANPSEPNDAMNLDDEELLAQLNENPDALAAQLNDISPATAASIIDEVHNEAPKKETKAEPAAFTPQKQVKEMTTAEFIKGQQGKNTLRERIQPDTTLPAVIKEVEKKAFEGIPEAQHDLAAIYTAGHGGVETNYERSALWFRESAIGGIANARYNLGVLYHQGLGVKEDINTAVNWYRAAAEMGHPEAQYNLGIAYIEGIGTRYNPDKASHYFEKAANEGIMEAAYNLGLIHENGLTGESRPDEALYWYKQAADKGSPEAKVAMDQLAKTLGLMPNEVEKLYSDIGKDKKASLNTENIAPVPAPAPVQQSAARAAPPPPPVTTDSASSEVEYIEAQPLNEAPPPPVPTLAEIEENGNSAAEKNKSRKETADPAIIAQIQEQLIRVGLYPGPADGVNDTLTEDAIRAYQANYNLTTDGRASQALLVHMMTSELGSNAEFGSRE